MSAVPDSAIVLIGMACRVPGADSIEQFAELLYDAKTGYGELPLDRCDRSLYYDPAKGVTGRTYATLGGIVPERRAERTSTGTEPLNDSARFDVTHRHFAETVATAWGNAGLSRGDSRVGRTGIFVGHSGGTKLGGALSLGTQIEEALTGLNDIPAFRELPNPVQRKLIHDVAAEIRKRRPSRSPDLLPCFQAYQAASLAAGFLRLSGPRSVIDAACASSLVALSQAILAIRSGRIETAVVGGATYNNVDNLILFSHSQACTSEISRPFDDRANGLVSSEGYVAVVVTTAARAREYGFRVETVIRGLGISSDGRGKSLWAPRSEGQTLALRRAYEGGQLLDVDYLECHATSTQLGDATELESLKTLCSSPERPQSPAPLLLGSVKSNIGHTLEAAGLIGMVKVLLAMKQGTIPPSLNFEIPNRRFDWKNAPFQIVQETTRWPSSLSRRAAVSAFGIGGLNAHVIVEQPSDRDARNSSTTAQSRNTSGARDSTEYRVTDEPIAIVGRGIVVAGAVNLLKFGQSIRSGQSMLGPAPEDRWRNEAGIRHDGEPASGRTPTSVGGYIRDFQFDGQKYRIPPRQVQQSNPAQMMLLDAVAQSLEDCRPGGTGPSDWPFSRERTSVVVGTVFGGEFGDNLQIGMRLPEISELLIGNLVREGVSAEDAKRICDQFAKEFLKNRPALLDETGSFTASTLASRIAKTFDLMGGACALDADCSSGLTALQICVDQLRSGERDLMVCGATQRSMNLAAFEQLDLSGRLVRSGRPEDVPDNCSRILPGEGVAVLLLCRLSDAVSRGLPIHGLVGDLQYEQSDSKGTVLTADDAKIVRQFGYLFGAHSLVRIIAQTIEWENLFTDRMCTSVRSMALDGLVVESRIMPPDFLTSDDLTRDDLYIVDTEGRRCESPDLTRSAGIATTEENINEPVTPMNFGNETSNSSERGIRRIRFSAASPAEMMQLLVRIQEKPDEAFSGSVSCFQVSDSYRVFILAESAEQLKERLAGVIKAWGRGRYSVVLEREKAVFWNRSEQAVRVAGLFPGQGSHYVGTPSVVSSNSFSVTDVSELDEVLAKQGLEPVSALLNSGSGCIGDHIWFAQLWVLGVSRILFQALTRSGIRPDIVLGHSFGEFSAACAAGSLSLQELVRVSRMRADALALHVREPGGLLSVRGGLAEVDAVIRSAGLSVFVTHHNSLRQTVVAGTKSAMASAEAAFSAAGLANISVPVPAAFHTPLMSEAQTAYERMMSTADVLPPRCGFLSATSLRYVAEPEEIRQSLVRQLTQPVNFVSSVQRLHRDGCRVFIEVGPNDVLTRLNREIFSDDALCVSLDVPGQTYAERIQFVQTILECVSSDQSNGPKESVISRRGMAQPETVQHSRKSVDVQVFDVTRNRYRGSSVPEPTSGLKVASGVESSDPSKATSSVSPSGGISELSVRASQKHVSFPETSRSSSIVGASDEAARHTGAANTRPGSAEFTEDQVGQFLLDLVVELTGYSREIVEFQADLEADLGIDSIKKAQIIGELFEWRGIRVVPSEIRLDDVRTLSDIARLTNTQNGVTDSDSESASESRIADREARFFEPEHSENAVGSAKIHESSKPASGDESGQPGAVSSSEMQRLLIDFIVDQTGYSRDIVDLDADLEADLGVDSIKLAQLIGEVREHYRLNRITTEDVTGRDFRTLRAVRDFLQTQLQNAGVVVLHDDSELSHADDVKSGDVAIKPSAAVDPEEPKSPVVRNFSEIPEAGRMLFVPDLERFTAMSPEDYQRFGMTRGQEHSHLVRSILRNLFENDALFSNRNLSPSSQLNAPREAWLRGLAQGAGVAYDSVRIVSEQLCHNRNGSSSNDRNGQNGHAAEGSRLYPCVEATGSDERTDAELNCSTAGTRRYALRVMPAPQRSGVPEVPRLNGDVLIVGEGSLADELTRQLKILGRDVYQIRQNESVQSVEQSLLNLWSRTETPHLFLATPFDSESMNHLTGQEWARRRTRTLDVPFRVCQLWMQRMIERGAMENASVVALTRLGGDFGFSGRSVECVEAVGGLVKAMLIEAWMRGFRTTPMKVIDVAPQTSHLEAVRGILRELAVPSFDVEVALHGQRRMSVQAVEAKLPVASPAAGQRAGQSSSQAGRITAGGVWIVSGGGRGITAMTAMRLAAKHRLRLHLLGTAPVPEADLSLVTEAKKDRAAVRRQVMKDASNRGENPVECWRDTEKAIEIQQTLLECRSLGISAVYHCCDVSDRVSLMKLVEKIRREEGPIRGVLHGAGAGQDSRFDRKRPEKVDRCLRAKIDGTLALIEATNGDPLEWFVGYGSISGRFGANGHTDYSLANDMMAKIIDRYRSERPEVRSTTFHWHAWGDIGMATKPEARLALEMIDMVFMPGEDGVRHFLEELEYGGDEPEVLITDEQYFRKFYPADRLASSAAGRRSVHLPLIGDACGTRSSKGAAVSVLLNPLTDRFLSQHRISGKPTLPFVVALELMAEGFRHTTGHAGAVTFQDAEAFQALRFSTDDPITTTVRSEQTPDGGSVWQLLSDFRRRDGRLVESDRKYFSARILKAAESQPVNSKVVFPDELVWVPIDYPKADALIYHGPELQELRQIAVTSNFGFGRISASAPVQLFGAERARGFTIPCSTMDACLYAVAVYAWKRFQKPSLPVRFGSIRTGRLPDPGEPCVVRIEFCEAGDRRAVFCFELFGNNGDCLLRVEDYQIAWLNSQLQTPTTSHVSRQ